MVTLCESRQDVELQVQGEYLMIGVEIEVEKLDDAVTLTVNPESDDYLIELSHEAFDALARSLDFVTSQDVGYMGRYCFDVTDDED